MIKQLTTLTLAASFLAAFPGAAIALPPQAAPQAWQHACDAPAGMACVEFVHPEAGPPQPAVSATCNVTTDDQVGTYGLAGWHLTGPFTYRVNYATDPSSVGGNTTAQTAIASAFGAWSTADPDKSFVEGSPTTVKTSKYDGVNAVLWGSVPRGAIAVARVWYYTSTGNVAEADVVFGRNLPWAASDPSLGDCNGNPNAYELYDIATHEFGHVVGLNDLYGDGEKDLTMYGYGTKGELKKYSLGAGDVLGNNAVMP